MNCRFLPNLLLLSRLLGLLVLASCASQPKTPIANADFKGPTLAAVRANPDIFLDQRVRWGGSIARVENRRDDTLVEIVQHPLLDSGRPRSSTTSAGRFIARIPGFLDPAIYAEERQLTVVGTLQPSIARNIGEYPYQYPVVVADTFKLWKESDDSRVIYYYPDPFWGIHGSYRRFNWGWYPPYRY
jgi:outer membrane lipoprotein